MTATNWTDAQVAILRELWPTDTSATEIGERCGKTKRAVIGKADRLNLGEKLQRNLHKPRPNARKKIVPTADSQLPVEPETDEDDDDFGLPKFSVVMSTDADPDFPVTLEELEHGMCRWPIGDSLSEDIRFCGQPSKGKPFCDCHDAKAYTPSRGKSPMYAPAHQRRLGGFR